MDLLINGVFDRSDMIWQLTGLLRVEDIVDLDELWGGDDEGEGGLGLGDQANSGVDGQTGVLYKKQVGTFCKF